MKHTSTRITPLLAAVVALVVALTSSFAHAACSAYIGKVVINEVRVDTGSGQPAFVELKVLDPSVVAATSNFSGWKVAAYAGSNGNKGEADLSSAFTSSTTNTCGQNSTWLRIPDSVLGTKLNGASSLNLVLFDSAGSGSIVDIMRMGSTSVGSYYDTGSTYSACTTIESTLPATIAADSKYDAVKGSGSSVKDYFRDPDGTGNWGGAMTTAGAQTNCGSNNGGGVFGLSKIASSSSIPTNTNFTFTLYAQNGATGTTQSGVVVSDDLTAAGLTFVSCTPGSGSGTCTYSGGVVTWSIGSVAANATKTAALIVSAATAGAKTNTITSNVGTPAASATATVQAYAPLADWRMDEASWAGVPNEVKDSSGNGNHGVAKVAVTGTAVASTNSGSPAYTSGSQNTCNYGDFDRASGPTRSQTYVELTGLPTLGTSFTFAAWIRSTNASQSGQRILVKDDADNGWGFSLGDPGAAKIRLFNRKITNSGAVIGDGSNPGCGVFCLDTAAVITNNAWYFVAVAIDTTGKTVQHYVYDNSTSSTPLSNTSTSFSGNWTDGTGKAAIGGETSASSEGTRAAADFHFKGNIDEMQIYSGVLSQSDINILRTRARSCSSTVDHIELVHNGAALTCTPKAVTVYGCTTSASCNGVSANQISTGTLSFTPTAISGAQWCTDALCASPISGSVTISNGSTIYLREPTARTDTMAGTASGASNSVVQCTNTGAVPAFGSSTAACGVAFAGSGFLVNVPNHTSCAAQTVTLQAVQASATGNTCVPAFSGVSRDVKLHLGYTNPTSGTKTASFQYLTSSGGVATIYSGVDNSSAVSTSPDITLSNLYFDTTGTATLSSFKYPDVGQVTLYPTYTGSATTNDANLSLAAVSGNVFIAAPASFDVVAAGPYVAGQSFSATVTAKNACSPAAVAPNFGKEATAQTVLLKSVTAAAVSAANSQLVGPSGGQLGSLTPGVFTAAKCSPVSSGAVCDTALAWTEVGDVTLAAVNTTYLGYTTTSWGSGAAGPFKPASFKTELNTTQSCGTFTYAGQPFRIKVTAQSAANTVLGTPIATTQNYTGIYAKTVTFGEDGSSACTPTVTGFSNNTLSNSDFATTPGSATTALVSNTSAPLPISYTRALATPSGVTICAKDADGVNSHGQTQASVLVRNGRARMLNAYGSELLELPVVFRTEYLSALPSDWRINTADVCTNPTLTFAAVGTDIRSFTCAIESTNNSGVGCAATPVVANHRYLEAGVSGTDSSGIAGFAGNFNLWLLAPGASHAGAIDITASVPAWLQYGWISSTSTNPTARATFGVYKSPLIYRRENY
jgi:MSHA biogenesis protein MshQ